MLRKSYRYTNVQSRYTTSGRKSTDRVSIPITLARGRNNYHNERTIHRIARKSLDLKWVFTRTEQYKKPNRKRYENGFLSAEQLLFVF